jgi:hypothetical protein
MTRATTPARQPVQLQRPKTCMTNDALETTMQKMPLRLEFLCDAKGGESDF